MIVLKNISKVFSSELENKSILSNISFEITEGTFTTFFGPNGCGKSTLVNIIAGLGDYTSGEIVYRTEIKNNLGYVFQDYRKSLLPWKNVKENILFPLRLKNISENACNDRLAEILDLTGIELDLAQPVTSLSGGQAQAVSILRALIVKPKLLILDEPFAAIDFEKTLSLRKLISKVSKKLNLTVLFISHDLDEALLLGDQVIFLSNPPTRIIEIIKIELNYPRENTQTATDEFLVYKKKALNILNQMY
jgi:NitT/TauT family transport system ATP-binding protein